MKTGLDRFQGWAGWIPMASGRWEEVLQGGAPPSSKGLQRSEEPPGHLGSALLSTFKLSQIMGFNYRPMINLPTNKVGRTPFLKLHSCAVGITGTVFFKIEIVARRQNLYLPSLHSGLASQVSTSALTPRSALKGPVLSLMLCCQLPEMYNNFTFELVFCKWSPVVR